MYIHAAGGWETSSNGIDARPRTFVGAQALSLHLPNVLSAVLFPLTVIGVRWDVRY